MKSTLTHTDMCGNSGRRKVVRKYVESNNSRHRVLCEGELAQFELVKDNEPIQAFPINCSEI